MKVLRTILIQFQPIKSKKKKLFLNGLQLLEQGRVLTGFL